MILNTKKDTHLMRHSKTSKIVRKRILSTSALTIPTSTEITNFSQWMPHGEMVAAHRLKRVNNTNTAVCELIDCTALFFFKLNK